MIIFLLLVFLVLIFSSISTPTVGYVSQNYWYTSGSCKGPVSVILSFQIGVCVLYSPPSVFVIYSMLPNVANTTKVFQLSMSLYTNNACTISNGQGASVSNYQQNCSSTGPASSTTSVFSSQYPAFTSTGSLVRLVLISIEQFHSYL